ncbi:tetratricopeptide repeat protein [Crocosphaera sp.]|uniref:tetratricopeptide repeat protein n=1 Tax=Crocosphaera sp. TaxID=2729996 RepID=UPI003F26C2B6|nr:tetratricopeptide repeat protein [Crocosphaera sp.]
MHLLSKIYLLFLILIASPHLVLSQSLNDSLMVNSQRIAQTYISDPHLNDLLIQGMEKGIQGDYQGAIALFTEILQFNPHEVEAYYNRGIAYTKINNYQAAIADFTQALTLNSTIPDLYIERAKVHLKLGNRTEAIADLKKAKALLRQQGNTSRYSEIDQLLN